MGINLSKNEEQLASEIMGKISLAKDKEKLGGHVVNLSKCVIDLSKKAQVDIGNVRARVITVLDYSGSMSRMYKDGTVQKTLDKLMPLGLTFDDNGEIEVYLFQNGYKKLPELTIDNYDTYVKNVINTCGYSMGGTEYAPVLKAIKDIHNTGAAKGGLFGGLFGKKAAVEVVQNADEIIFIIFITDGDNSDKSATNEVVREMSKMKDFIQFVGIGSATFGYLEQLDDLDGRACDNTGFTKFADVANVEDNVLYANVLEQFADWLKIMG